MSRKKVLQGFGIFMGVMLFCTLISRGIYAAALPQVTLEHPKQGAVSHKVKADGNVRQGRELALCTEAGVRVAQVLVEPGDRVTEGETLFLLDTDHIREQMAQNEREINQQRLELATLQHNTQLAAEEKNREMIRAGEDYVQAQKDARLLLKRAEEDESWASQELLQIEEKMPQTGTDDPEYEMWRQEWKAAYQEAQAARRALEDAQNHLQEVQQEADRTLEDALTQEMTDASLGGSRMKLDALYEKQGRLQSLLDGQGAVCAQQDSIITGLFIRVGQDTPEGGAVLYADASAPLSFCVVLDPEQKKYVEPGMEGKLTLTGTNGRPVEVTVDYLTEMESVPGSYTGTMTLPEGIGRIGQTGTFETTVQSEVYGCCIPVAALHQDENQNWFCYVYEERATMLGREPVAEKRVVTVLDKNERLAAIEPGVVDEDTLLITESTKEFRPGDVVRKKE